MSYGRTGELRQAIHSAARMRQYSPRTEQAYALSRDEVRRLLRKLHGTERLVAALLYGSGLRLMEALQLRVKDIDFEYSQIHLHETKGKKDRLTMLAARIVPALRRQLHRARTLHEAALAKGLGTVELPKALAGKAARRIPRMGMVVGLPGDAPLRGPANGGATSPPPPPDRDPTSGPPGGARG